MNIIAVLTGGVFGTITSLIALFFMGVDWSTGVTIYFLTATLIALPIISVGTLRRHKNKDGPNMSDWDREFRGDQPSPMMTAPITGRDSENSPDQKAA